MHRTIGRYTRGGHSCSGQTSAPQAAFISEYWPLQLEVYAHILPLFAYSEHLQLFVFVNGKRTGF